MPLSDTALPLERPQALSVLLARLDAVSNASFTDATVNAAGRLILTRADGIALDLGLVRGAPGADVGIQSATLNAQGRLILTRTDGSTLDAGLARGTAGADGTPGVSIISATINAAGRLILTLSNNTTVDAGNAKGAAGLNGTNGVSVTSATITNGRLILTLSSGATVDAGVAKGADGINGLNGKSNYELAQQSGFTGTQAQYVDSVSRAGILPRRTGGAAGVVVLSGDAWQTSAATEYARFGNAFGVLDATGIVVGYRQGGTCDVSGWGLVTGQTYYLPPGAAGGYANWLAMPAGGLPSGSVPATGQVRIVLGTVRAEGSRQLLDLRPDGLDFGPAPAGFQMVSTDIRTLPFETALTAPQAFRVWGTTASFGTHALNVSQSTSPGAFTGWPDSPVVDGSGRKIYLRDRQDSTGIYSFTTHNATYTDGQVLYAGQSHDTVTGTPGSNTFSPNLDEASVMIRGTGTPGSVNGSGYRVRRNGTGAATFQIMRVVNGVETQIAQSTAAPVINGGAVNIRAEAVGNVIRARIWEYDATKLPSQQTQSEPSVWHVEFTDADPAAILTAGYWGAAHKVNYHEVYSLGYAIGGGIAAVSP